MFLIALFVAGFLIVRVESGACGCGLPPPMPICPPALPTLPPIQMCPPAPICPPPILPPPCPACPLPLPPPPCPAPLPCPPITFCPPPTLPPPPSPCGYAQPAPQLPQPMPTYSQAPSNDCCKGRARTHGSRIFSALSVNVDEDPTCNSEKLRAVIEENITSDPTISKRAIQQAAEERLFAKINVICGREDFSYVMYTDTYCQATSGDITCYAFRPLSGVGVSSSDM
ncbi:Ground-like domain-containing protein [Aphelenchoides bicaudatus]|nr:Ground-like domain-containing protein [Aphelenchoides bicaudatus]